MFGGDTRRPIESGIINPREHEGVDVIKAIVNKLIDVPHKPGEKICFSVPGEPLDGSGSVVYHESIVKMHLKSLGYEPEAVNEGLTVVLSELAGNNYTGIGLSVGGGMCNVCFSYLSVPVIMYSIQKGGDYIDSMVGGSVGEPSTKIKRIKEAELDLAGEPKNRIETGLHIYYDDLFSTLAQSLRQALGSSENIPRLSKAVPLVLSGGSVMPNGSRDKFMSALNEVRLPIRISDIVVTEDPLLATADGALAMAMIEEEDF
ncbi:MAG: hypothetical protein GY859_08715 [Desulfobacterales bacterium]|nr:hypothetical protein [Desulfobacterales bacterium]